jgi:hypothetical protein
VDVVKEIELLKYQNKLLQTVVNGDEYPFFMFVLNHNINETQVKVILKVLNTLQFRLNNNSKEDLKRFIETNKKDEQLFMLFNIDLKSIYANEPPSLEEFKGYVQTITSGDFITEYLLMSLIKQEIQTEVCNYLLNKDK